MPYTDGPAHTLTGTGIVQVASPAGLRWHFTAVPNFLGGRSTLPRRYSGLGTFALGDGAAFGYHVPLELVDQLVYPLADGVVRVSYDLAIGAAATLTELVGAAAATRPMPWDRNPVAVSDAPLAWNPANTAQAQLFAYTVPAGKRLWLTSARARHTRVANPPAATLNTASGWIAADGVGIICRAWLGYLHNVASDDFVGPLYLPAGAVLRGWYANSETSGGVYTTLSYTGTLFDA